ncbi:kinase-like domain-containing protein [Podospora fimiseda]|uniref:Kinase-like domain-containing protein n=1 Tax=Podospora fimiseda TaxID=252190 RepID=A0AAN7BPZ2_9PEZI|nr:kinase-like domain-containing protein [Podospora fimiseda]
MASETPPDVEAFPAGPGDITPSWLSSKLGIKVSQLEHTRLIWGTESKLFYTVTYSEDAGEDLPKYICIKGVFDPAMVAAQPWTVSLARREGDFFSKIAPLLKGVEINFPKVYWSGTSDSQGICIMEDLTHSGCTFAPEVASYGVDVVIDGVEQLAAYHGLFWGKGQEDKGFEWIWNNYDPAVTFLVSAWDQIVTHPGRIKLPEFLSDGEKINKVLKQYYEGRNPKFRTLLHGDTHVGNVYFTKEGKLGFLDWSTIHFGSCFHDVVYFMTALMTIEDRRKHEMEILDRYLKKLGESGGPVFDRNDEGVMKEYRRSMMTNVVWTICPHDLQTPERVNMLCERAVATLEDHNTLDRILAEREE